jgi:hypothetical protein
MVNMWTCSKCGRIFQRSKQPHSCKKVSLESHFKGKKKAKEIFNHLVKRVNKEVDKCKIISIPCCIHLFGKYDFLAALPKRDRLEIRFALDRKLDSPRLKQCVPLSKKVFKNCFDISSKAEIDNEFMGWLKESYSLK